MPARAFVVVAACLVVGGVVALNAAETSPRPIPPPGIPVPDDVRTELTEGAAELRKKIDEFVDAGFFDEQWK